MKNRYFYNLEVKIKHLMNTIIKIHGEGILRLRKAKLFITNIKLFSIY